MSMLIVPEPLFDSSMAVQAYRLCSHDGSKILNVQNLGIVDEFFSNPGLDIVDKIGIEPFTGDKKLFVDISQMQLLAGTPMNMNLPSKKLVCILPASLLSETEDAPYIQKLIDNGYTIGVNGCPESPTEFKDSISCIVLDYRNSQFSNQYYVSKQNFPKATTIILNVPNMDTYSVLKKDKNAYFAGNFYSKPITKGKAQLSPVKVNLLHLLSNVNQEDFDLKDIVLTIERDPYLAISLLKFINSDSTNLRRKVDSIQQAIAILGQKSVRRWASVALSVSLAEDRPNEITKLALVRAKFAEELATAFELGILASDLFIAGLFSLLDVMLEKPMSEAINEVAVDERIKEVLIDKKGPFAPVMDLVYAYERADWDSATIIMIHNDIEMGKVRTAYLNSLKWYSNLLKSIDDNTLAR